MTTLFDALLDVARYCGITVSGKTTAGGSFLYLVDTTRYEVDDYFNHGTVLVRTGDCAGITRRVTDYDQATGLITWQPATPHTVDQNVYYTLTNVNRETLVQAVNEALLTMGQYIKIDETLTVVDNMAVYDLPTGVSHVRRVEIATQATNPQIYYRPYNWIEKDGKLIFPREIFITSGRSIRLYYPCYHPEVNDDTDEIRVEYNRERLAWTATAMFMLNRMQYSGNADERETFLLTHAQTKAEEMTRKYPMRLMVKDPKLGVD